jgi:hypothetical protein
MDGRVAGGKTDKRKGDVMKGLKLTLIIMAAGLVTFGLSGVAGAFHDDGAAYCSGCHTMHNSQDGEPVTDTPGGSLLIRPDSSSVCLDCHADYGQFTEGGSGYGSGGDFHWLTKTYTWEAHGHAAESTGDSHGHNIKALDFNLDGVDDKLTVAPGGTYLSQYLTCTSCHDPHGRQGNVRILWGIGDTTPGYPGGYTFENAAPIMAVTSRRTRFDDTRGEPVSDKLHTAYGSGASEWCANCHEGFLNTGLVSGKHPAGMAMGQDIATNYNAYVSTGDMTGQKETAYWEIVPCETGDTDPANLDTESTVGASASGRVMCMSCHRSHATAFPDIGKWYFRATLIAHDSHPQLDDGGVTGGAQEIVNSYYGRTFTDEQRSLCNKCHVND